MDFDQNSILADFDDDGAFNSNNGCGHLENKGPIIGFDKFRYRSQAERKIGEQLSKISGLTYGSNAVFRSRDEKGKMRKIEIDFWILYKGQQLLVEIDGPHHTESVTVAESRLMPFRDCVLEVRRYPVEDNDEWANETVQKIIRHMTLRSHQSPRLPEIMDYFERRVLEVTDFVETRLLDMSAELQSTVTEETDDLPF